MLENTALPGAAFACIYTEPQLKCQSKTLVVDVFILCPSVSRFQTISSFSTKPFDTQSRGPCKSGALVWLPWWGEWRGGGAATVIIPLDKQNLDVFIFCHIQGCITVKV